MIPESKWKWFGLPMHFICSDLCRYHLGTQVGKYLVSSVGLMYIDGKAETVGATGYYEVYVFEAGLPQECGCPSLGDHIEGQRFGFDTEHPEAGHTETDAYHREMCEKYAAMQEDS